MRSPRTATKSSPRSSQPEKACAQQQRPNAAKNKNKIKKKKLLCSSACVCVYVYVYIYIYIYIYSLSSDDKFFQVCAFLCSFSFLLDES